MSDKKYLYLFSEGNKDMREILGGKGANLAEMTNAGMPVPQGFTITTEACTQYYNDGRQINEEHHGRHLRVYRQDGGDRRQEVRRPRPTPCWFPSVPARALPCPA